MFARIRLLAALPVFAVMLAAPGETAAQSYAEGYQAFNAGNYETARQIWQDLADRGDTLAMIGLGTLYERGFGVRQNAERALQLYRRAANAGDSRARSYVQRLEAQRPATSPTQTDMPRTARRGGDGGRLKRIDSAGGSGGTRGSGGLQAARGPYVSVIAGPIFRNQPETTVTNVPFTNRVSRINQDNGDILDIDQANVPATVTLETDYDVGIGANIEGGWDFGLFRVQGAFAYDRVSGDRIELLEILAPGLNPVSLEGVDAALETEIRSRTLSGLVSLHGDFAISETVEISPYGGVGASATSVETAIPSAVMRRVTEQFDVEPGAPGADPDLTLTESDAALDGSTVVREDEEADFIWELGVDMSVALSDAILTLGYGFTRYGEDFNTHSIRVGTRFYF